MTPVTAAAKCGGRLGRREILPWRDFRPLERIRLAGLHPLFMGPLDADVTALPAAEITGQTLVGLRVVPSDADMAPRMLAMDGAFDRPVLAIRRCL